MSNYFFLGPFWGLRILKKERISRLVEIAMEAMDLLLMACHVQTLNLFVESFLKMVQKLLEDSNANLQIMATNSVSFLSLLMVLGYSGI